MYTRYLDIDDLTDDLRDALDDAKPHVLERFRQLLDFSWIHHENALEGVVLTYPEMHGALTQSRVTDLANVTLYKKIRAWFTALEMGRAEAQNKKFRFSVPLFESFYQTLYMGLDRDKGKYRRDIPLHRTYFHDIAEPTAIQPGLEELLKEVNGKGFQALHPIKQAAVFGHRFMQVFPWSEASGPVGRMMSNILLMRAGYYPVIIHAQDRELYYQSLKGSPNDLRELIIDSMENGLRNSRKLLQVAAESSVHVAG